MFSALRGLGRTVAASVVPTSPAAQGARTPPLALISQSRFPRGEEVPFGLPTTARLPPPGKDVVALPRSGRVSHRTFSHTSFCSRRGSCAGLVEQAEVLGSASSVLFVRWATKKQGGSSNNGRDSNPKFLGIKKFGGEYVKAGNIIARQRGTKWHPGENCGIGVDHTLFALVEGRVHFSDNHIKKRKVINIVPLEVGGGRHTKL